jgi:hypothetical protein
MKQTTQSLLKEIRDLLKEHLKLHHTNTDEKSIQQTIEIVDDGTLKTSEIIAKMEMSFKVDTPYSLYKLDKYFPPVKTRRKFLYLQEADPENAGKSANDLDQSKCITLRERLLFELEYFKREGKHLDVNNISLCAGSRHSGGYVPHVDWSSDRREVFVGWCRPGSCRDYLRSRSVVS